MTPETAPTHVMQGTSPDLPSRSALALLRAEHSRLDALLRRYALLAAAPDADPSDREALLARVGATLKALIGLEEEILYPLLEGRVQDAELQAARSDHRRLEDQLRVVAERATDNVAMDRGMTHLAELARAHIAFEEERLLPAGEPFDSARLCDRMVARRAELRGDQGPDIERRGAPGVAVGGR